MMIFKETLKFYGAFYVLFAVSFLTGTCLAEITDREFVENYDKVIEQIACGAMAQQEGSEMKVNLSKWATFEELANLAFWNYGNDFSKTELVFGEDIEWKRTLINTLFSIFKSSCPDYAVPHGYMNIFRELAMIYLNSVEPRETNNTSTWLQLQTILKFCEKSSVPYNLLMSTMKVVGIASSEGDTQEKAPIYPPEEKVDAFFNKVDWVVENLWFVFSHALGKCYQLFPQRAVLVPKFKVLFVRDILRPLMNRWADPGPHQDFGPIVGNFDTIRIQRNIRFCVTAGYLTNGIIELQMVRPLRVGHSNNGYNSVLNRKTGNAIF